MAVVSILLQQKAQAIEEGILLVEELLDEESPRLSSAQHDVTARSMEGFDVAMLAAELARVAAAQQKRIEGLEREVKALSEKAEPT